jgi:hypothetical protein
MCIPDASDLASSNLARWMREKKPLTFLRFIAGRSIIASIFGRRQSNDWKSSFKRLQNS